MSTQTTGPRIELAQNQFTIILALENVVENKILSDIKYIRKEVLSHRKSESIPLSTQQILSKKVSLYIRRQIRWQSDAAPFCKYYAKLYFDRKPLEKGLNSGWWNFWCPFFFSKKLQFLANIGCRPNFLD